MSPGGPQQSETGAVDSRQTPVSGIPLRISDELSDVGPGTSLTETPCPWGIAGRFTPHIPDETLSLEGETSAVSAQALGDPPSLASRKPWAIS